MTTLPEKQWLRPDEVADYLSIPIKTLYGWIAEGKVDAVKLGPSKLLRIRRETAESLLQPTIK